MSSLKGKLRSIAATTGKAPEKPAQKQTYVREYTTRMSADPRVFALSQPGFGRMLGDENALWRPQTTLFLDTETTGLNGVGTLAFLVGLGWFEGDAFVIRQYLALDYPGEPEMLAQIGQDMSRFESVVSFNGKTFDLPLLSSRFTIWRLRHLWRELSHIDLLHPARRLWKLRLRDCSLSNLEAQILGMPREHDIPGNEIPQRYFDYLKLGDEALLQDIVEHNRQDIASMMTLLCVLCTAFGQPRQLAFAEDLFSAGRALERQGHVEDAALCYAESANVEKQHPVRGRARYALSMLDKRRADFDSAQARWQAMIQSGEGGIAPYVELAKYKEHRQRKYGEALTLVEAALVLSAEAENVRDTEALLHRRARLLSKMQLKKNKTMGRIGV